MARNATRKAKKSHTARKEAKLMLKHQGHRSLDLVKESVVKNQPIPNIEDMPAGGKFACLKCDLYFRDEHTLTVHNRTKAHKKRLKEWIDKCHNAKDAERAAGLF